MANTTSTQKPKDNVTVRELVWLIEAAQEREQITVGTFTQRGLYSDLGDARRAVARFTRLALISDHEDGETKGHDILLSNVVRLLRERGGQVPSTAGLTPGEWQLTSINDRDPNSERIILARQETGEAAVVATIHAHIPLSQMPWGAPDGEEREVNGRAIAAAPRFLHLVKLFLNHHAICGEDEPGEGCPCDLCEHGRTLIAMVYGRPYTPRTEEDDE